MKRTLVILFIALLSIFSADQMSRAQVTPTDEVMIIPLPVPPNVIGTFVRGVSNDGKRIVFDSINDYNGRNVDSNKEIYVYDVDSRSIIMITDTLDITDPMDSTKVITRINSETPAISGDGTKIVFVSNASLGGTQNEDRNYEVYLADLPRGSTTPAITRITDTDKNNETEVVKEIFNNYVPSINNDGSLISFVSTRLAFKAIAGGASGFTALNEGPNSNTAPDGNGEIFIYNTIQRTYRQVTATRDIDATQNFVVRGFNINPKLSGNGQSLVFLSGFNFTSANANKNTDFNGEIFVYKVGDPVNSVRQVTETTGNSAVPISGSMNVLRAFSSPINNDGTKIVFESAGNFESKNSDMTREVFLADLSGAAPVFKQITNQATADFFTSDFNFGPSINSAGTHISFSSVLNLTPATTSGVKTDNADGSREVFRYDIANDKIRQLTFTPLSQLVFDQRDTLVAPFINSAGNLVNFSYSGFSIAPNAPITDDLFQALIRPVNSKNTDEAKIVNAASFNADQVARGSLVAAFGTQLSNSTASAGSTNLPFELGGVTVSISGIAARIIFISPGQINFLLPSTIANGDTVDFTINNNGVQSAGKVKIVDTAAGIFTTTGDGKGKAAVQCGRLSADGLSFLLSAPPCSVGNEGLFDVLVIYGTGWRNSTTIQVKIGEATLDASFSGPQPDFPGLDQINVSLTKALAGKENLEVSVVPLTTLQESNKGTVSFLPFEENAVISSAASFQAGFVAPGSSAIAQGMNLSNTTAASAGTAELDGVKVSVAGIQTLITAVSPTRVDFVIPQQVMPAQNVEVEINNNGTISRGRVNVEKAIPGLFTTTNDGMGRARAQCGKPNPDGSVTFTNPPCAVGTEASPNILRIFGTGWRNAEKVTVKIGDTDVENIFVGAQPNALGVDIVDVKLVPSLAGRTDVNIVVTTSAVNINRTSQADIKISFSQ